MNISNELNPTEGFNALAESLPTKWRQQFVTFVTSGVATEEFLAFLDSDHQAQQAVEAAVSEEVRNFNDFAQSLNIDPELIASYRNRKKSQPLDVARNAVSKIATGLLEALSLKPRERRDAVHAIAVAIPADQASQVLKMLEELHSDVDASNSHRAVGHFEINPTR